MSYNIEGISSHIHSGHIQTLAKSKATAALGSLQSHQNTFIHSKSVKCLAQGNKGGWVLAGKSTTKLTVSGCLLFSLNIVYIHWVVK